MASIAQDILDRGIAQASIAAAAQDAWAGQAVAAISSLTQNEPTFTFSVTEKNIGEAITVAMNAVPKDAIDLSGKINSMYASAVGNVASQYNAVLNTFINDSTLTPVYNWALAILNGNGSKGLAAAQAVYGTFSGEIAAKAAGSSLAAANAWSARGFPMPPGAANAIIRQSNLDAITQLGQLAASKAMSAMQIDIEYARLAIQGFSELYRFKQGVLSAAASYAGVLSGLSNHGVQAAVAEAEGRAHLISAMGPYVQAQVQLGQINYQNQSEIAKLTLQANMKSGEMHMAKAEALAKTLVGVSAAMGSTAAAAMNAINGVAQVVEQVNA